MLAVATLLFVIILSLLVTKVGAVALTVTGLSRQSAKFQARSAFSGAGFTTNEAEAVVDHPTRRRIIGALILLGNAGLASVVATLLLTFSTASNAAETFGRTVVLAGGAAALWLLVRSERVDRALTALIRRVLKRSTDLDVRDFAGLLNVRDGFTVAEVIVEEGEWMAGRTLIDLGLPDEGVLVLGIHRADGGFSGAPAGTDVMHPGDSVVLYGPGQVLTTLADRQAGREGQRSHERCVAAFEEYVETNNPDVHGILEAERPVAT